MKLSIELTRGRGAPAESRASLENPSVSLSDAKAFATIFGEFRSAAGVAVDYDVAMTVPAVFCAVSFLSACVASLPLKIHRKSQNGKEQIERGRLVQMLTGQVNEERLTSFNWRRDMMTSALLPGRGLTYVERLGGGDATQLFPFEILKTKIQRKNQKLTYSYKVTGSSEPKVYTPADVIDIKFLGRLDGVGHFDPVDRMRDTIGLGVALRTYGAKFFLNGGVPPLVMTGPAASPAAIARGKSDAAESVKQSARDEGLITYVPVNHDLKPLGFEPEKGQLIEAQNFVVTEIARMYNLPPAFLHHLVNATYSNVEQQDLNFVKHCLVAWIEQWEQELNAKLFGTAKGRFIEFDLWGLLRGDFLSRMQAYGAGIQNAVFKPNEARRRENLPDDDTGSGDKLYMNSTIQPIDTLGNPASTGADDGELDNPGDPQNDPEDDA